jgi:spermidine synthase
MEKIKFYREGINGSVLVGTDPDETVLWLRVGGKVDASTQDMDTQVLLGLLPTAMADSGARTLVVGLGSGVTVAAALAAGAGTTDVIELEPGVVEASRFFFPPGRGPLDDPRVRLQVADARTHIQHAAERYQLVISQPSNPWLAGINNLFTVDFYRRVKARLTDDGVFCQWMQLYEIDSSTFASMLRSFLTVFPEGELFCVWDAVDILLIAAPDQARLSLARLSTPEAREQLRLARVTDPRDVAGFWGGRFDALAREGIGTAPLNTDDRPIVEYRAPRDLVTVGGAAAARDPRVAAVVPVTTTRPAGSLFADWTDEDWYAGRVRMMVTHGETGRALKAVEGARAAGLDALADQIQADFEAKDRRRRADEMLAEADRMRALGNREDARRVIQSAVETDPTHGLAWLRLADQQRVAREFDAAMASIGRTAASVDTTVRTDAAMIGGMVEMDRGRALVAARSFAEAQRWRPNLGMAYALEARARVAAGDTSGAQDAVRRGLAIVPNESTLLGLAGSLGVR